MRGFSRDKKLDILTAFALFAAFALLLLLPRGYVLLVSAPISAAMAAIACFVMKKRSIHSYNKRQVLIIVLVFAFLFLTFFYLSGLRFGYYLSTKGRLSFSSLIKSILPILIIIFASEKTREVTLAQPIKAAVPLSYAACVLSDVICAGGIPSIRSSFQLADFFGMTLFPALTANILFTYISKRYGKSPCVLYRAILSLYAYLIPWIPDPPRALPAFVLLILPLIVLSFIDTLFERKRRFSRKRNSRLGIVFSGIGVFLMLGFVLLITCQFRFGMVVIATDSMSGNINRGDAVVYESYEHSGQIKENDVIVFKESNRRVVHRVVDINTVNGQRQYITKGDANEGIDAGFRTDGDIIGVVRFKVLYIGHPSLWLREILRK